MTPSLVLIGGPPWVGKTSTAEILFCDLQDCAWLDGDNVWRVNPFSISDPRLRDGDKNMAFVVQTYLTSSFRYVILSSVILTYREIMLGILDRIGPIEYDLFAFTLCCDDDTLRERCEMRGQGPPEPRWLGMGQDRADTLLIDTSAMSPQQVAARIKRLVMHPEDAGLVKEKWRQGARWVCPCDL